MNQSHICQSYISKVSFSFGKVHQFLVVKSQKGVTLVEVVIAMAILGILAVAFLGAINNSTETLITVDERETARNLAESQMEYVKELGYAPTYSPATIPSEYVGFTVNIATDEITNRDDDIQKITVTVQHRSKDVATLVAYKSK
jgi:type II secretion system protein I